MTMSQLRKLCFLVPCLTSGCIGGSGRTPSKTAPSPMQTDSSAQAASGKAQVREDAPSRSPNSAADGTDCREPPVVEIRLGATRVSGALEPALIRQTVREEFVELRTCFEAGLARNPRLSGKMVAQFVIAPSGAVQRTSNGGSSGLDQELVGCVLRTIAALHFPPPKAGWVHVSYPMSLCPGP